MILVSKTASRPSENRHFYLLESFDNVFSYAFYVRYLRIFANIHSVIDTSAKMFGEVSVYLRVDVGTFVCGIDKH